MNRRRRWKIHGYTLAFVLALVAAPAVAQTILSEVDLAALGYAGYTVRAIDADGDPSTAELLAVPQAGGAFQVIAQSPAGRLCFGAFFVPAAPLRQLHVDVVYTGLAHVLVVQAQPSGDDPPVLQRTVRLDRPECP